MNDPNTVTFGPASIAAAADSRAQFLVRTYNHLFGAIIAFVLIEVALFQSGIAEPLARAMGSVSWLLILGAFMIVGWLANSAAHRSTSKTTHLLALGGFVLAQAILFVPLLYIASRNNNMLQSAAIVTLLGFAALTGIVFWTRKNFSFLGGMLRWGGILALLAIVASVLFGFTLGTLFSMAMVAFAGAAILYDTSRVLHDFPEDRHVGAALALFASVALMFWYVLRLFMSRD